MRLNMLSGIALAVLLAGCSTYTWTKGTEERPREELAEVFVPAHTGHADMVADRWDGQPTEHKKYHIAEIAFDGDKYSLAGSDETFLVSAGAHQVDITYEPCAHWPITWFSPMSKFQLFPHTFRTEMSAESGARYELKHTCSPGEGYRASRGHTQDNHSHWFEKDDRRFWLENMACHHRYSVEEMAAATGWTPAEVARRLDALGIRAERRPAVPSDRLLVLPYPGGRHPRIGFLDGAVNPQRDTKFSVFLPWPDAGYVVVDVPEAVWANGELIYLAHTHIPTVWDKRGATLERIDWTRKEGGVLESRRVLPDGVAFAARVVPRGEAVDMELKLTNGGPAPLKDLRAQVCVLLKGALDFNAQTADNKRLLGAAAAAASRDGRRWIVTEWERGKPWQNPPCPCIHSDPSFPDLAPGQEAIARGRVFFYEGDDPAAEVERRRQQDMLFPEAGK